MTAQTPFGRHPDAIDTVADSMAVRPPGRPGKPGTRAGMTRARIVWWIVFLAGVL